MKIMLTFITIFIFSSIIVTAGSIKYRADRNLRDREIVAAVLVAEAGGERDPRALAAVYEVICRRMELTGLTAFEVVTARRQFSCLDNRTTDELVARVRDHPKFAEALNLASGPCKTEYTRMATHFWSTARRDGPPWWAKGEPITAKIGHHLFYDLRGDL